MGETTWGANHVMADDKLLVLVVCRHMGEMLVMEKAPELEFWFALVGEYRDLDCFVTVMNASVAKLSC